MILKANFERPRLAKAAIAQQTGRARRTVERMLQQAQAQLIGLFESED